MRYSKPGRSSIPLCTVGRDRQRGQRTIVVKVAIVEADIQHWGHTGARVDSTPITCKRSKFTKVSGPGVVRIRGRQPVAEVYFQPGYCWKPELYSGLHSSFQNSHPTSGVCVRIELAAGAILHRSTWVISGDGRSFAVAHVLDRGLSHIALHGLNHFGDRAWSSAQAISRPHVCHTQTIIRRIYAAGRCGPQQGSRDHQSIHTKQTYSHSRELASASRRSDSIHGALPSGRGLIPELSPAPDVIARHLSIPKWR